MQTHPAHCYCSCTILILHNLQIWQLIGADDSHDLKTTIVRNKLFHSHFGSMLIKNDWEAHNAWLRLKTLADWKDGSWEDAVAFPTLSFLRLCKTGKLGHAFSIQATSCHFQSRGSLPEKLQ